MYVNIYLYLFFRNVFSWKSQNANINSIGGWKLFSKSSDSSINGSPQHHEDIVASSSALIQNIR